LLEGIRRRLDQAPEARLWSFDDNGQLLCTRYADLWDQAIRLRAGLSAAGVAPDSVIAGAVTRAPELVTAFWACLMAGHAFLPLSGRARRATREGNPESLRNLLSTVPKVRVLTDETTQALGVALDPLGPLHFDALATVESVPCGEPVLAPSPVVYLPTSGSSGRDKLARFDEATLLQRRFVRDCPEGPSQHGALWVFEPDSVTGFNTVFVSAVDWGVLSPEQVLARPAGVFEMLQASGATRLTLTSSLARRVIDAAEGGGPWRTPALSRISMGGEPVNPEVARRLRAVFEGLGAPAIKLFAGYGTTETGSLSTGYEISAHDTAATPVCLGGPAVGVSLRIVDEDGRLCLEGQEGSVEAKCPALFFSGYQNGHGLEESLDAQGWWSTGDRGWLKEGRLFLKGRDKDLIIVRGRKLALADIEAHMASVVGETCLALACVLEAPAGEELGVLVFGEPAPHLADALRGVLGRSCGIQPGKLAFADPRELPLAPGGKVQRQRLVELLNGLKDVRRDVSAEVPATMLETLWRECLPPGARIGGAAHFFEEGGDSLALQALFAGIEDRLGMRLEPAAFFADPTLRHLQRLIDGIEPVRSVPCVHRWPLPENLHRRLLAELETWPGMRPTDDGLMMGFNVDGTQPPLFWIFQGPREASALAAALGADQPLYAFRSGHSVHPYDDDTLQTIALRYAEDVLAVSPGGPLFVGGNCQGGRIALALANVLLARKIDVPLLVLMEWGFELAHYGGEVLFLHGAASLEGNPWLRHAAPELAWQRYLRSWEVAVIPGRHGHYFLADNAPGLGSMLRQHLAKAAAKPPQYLSSLARRAHLTLDAVPTRLAVGQGFVVGVDVCNASSLRWPEGLSLGNYWLDADGRVAHWRDGRVPLPALRPGERVSCQLAMRAPESTGSWTLVIDVVAEGGAWFDRPRRTVPSMSIEVHQSPQDTASTH
jgi:acyl-CoA synthetase (AMP-forming)/AMP-acid ligase II